MKKKRQDPLFSNPVTRSIINRQVIDSLARIKAAAELQAVFGDAAANLVRDAVLLLYSVAYACHLCRIDPGLPEIRILRGMAQTLEDLARDLQSLETHRPAIQSGLAAIERILPRLDIIAVGAGMLECDHTIQKGGIGAADIHQLLGAK